MKKSFLLSALLLASCNAAAPVLAGNAETAKQSALEAAATSDVAVDPSDSLTVVVDAETGCQYLVLNGSSLTPRMEDGASPYYHRQRGCRY